MHTTPMDDSTRHTEQSQESAEEPVRVSRAELAGASRRAEQLLAELARVPDGKLVGEIVSSALKLLSDATNRGDLKLINAAMKELRYALKIFAPYHDVRKVSIFGSARTPPEHPDYEQAVSLSRSMARAGWMVITGAGGGIMAAGHGGAGAEPSFGLSIRLPFETSANAHIANDPKLINFKYFFTRKLMFVRSSDAIALFPGGFGTLDEGFEVLTLAQTGKCVPMPIVLVDAPGGDFWRSWQSYVEKQLLARGFISPDDRRLYKITDSVDEAVREIQHFYSNFHSLRYTREDIVLRLHRRPTDEQLDGIESAFGDIKTSGAFHVSGPLREERDEPALRDLHRLVFTFNRRDHDRLRMLIDYLNDLPEDSLLKAECAL